MHRLSRCLRAELFLHDLVFLLGLLLVDYACLSFLLDELEHCDIDRQFRKDVVIGKVLEVVVDRQLQRLQES